MLSMTQVQESLDRFNADIDQKQAEINQLKEEIIEVRQAFDVFLQEVLSQAYHGELPGQTVNSIATRLYWQSSTWSFKAIAQITRCYKMVTHLPFKPGSIEALLTCATCGKEYQVVIKSQHEFQAMIAPIMPHCCGACQAKRERQAEASWQARMKKMEQRLAVLKAMPYREYLQTPEWQATRKKALRQAGYRCQLCHGEGVLNVHHNNYTHLGCEAPVDLIVLCAPCHAKHHDKVQP